MNQQHIPVPLRILAVINGIAFINTLLFWGTVYFANLVPLPGNLVITAERVNAATTYGFLVSDILWSSPLLPLAAIGLWRPRPGDGQVPRWLTHSGSIR